jgi:hypothetical protein
MKAQEVVDAYLHRLSRGKIWHAEDKTFDNSLALLTAIDVIPQFGRRVLYAVTEKIMAIPHGEPHLEPTRKDKLAMAEFFRNHCLAFNLEERHRMLAYVMKGIVRAEITSIKNDGPILKALFRYFGEVMAFSKAAPPQTKEVAIDILQKLLNDLNKTLDQYGMTVQIPSSLESFANLTRRAADTVPSVEDATLNFEETKEHSEIWEQIIDDEFKAHRNRLEADRQRLIADGIIVGKN